MTLGELLTRAALRRPEAEAVVDGTRRLSYAELDARAATAARGFRRLGVGKRDRVIKEIPKTASGKILRRLLREGRYTEVHP